jgi:hypothetical protein
MNPTAPLTVLFDFLTGKQSLPRIGGGSETDVYRSGDGRYVFKLKEGQGGTIEQVVAQAVAMRECAAHFAAFIGAKHSIPTYFLVAQNQAGNLCTIAVQPYLTDALPLAAVDRQTLAARQWAQIERQLVALLRRSLRSYKRTGQMPDLYGTFSRSVAERRRLNRLWMWPRRVWWFLTQRLWQAHNLMLTSEPEPRVILVDYDTVRWRGIWGRIYSAICWLLFWRELLLLAGWEATALIEEEFLAQERENSSTGPMGRVLELSTE